MNVLVIGLGSMGKRRIRLLLNNFKTITIYGIDKNQDRVEFCKNEYGITIYQSILEAKQHHKIDCVFICTAPITHNVLINESLLAGMHVFVELNLVADGYEENIELARSRNLVLFLSSTALYRKETQYIINKVHEQKKKVNYSYHVGQYLPDWHPWENYKDFFVGDKRTNGCREIMAIELPWIITAFGKIKELQASSNQISEMNLGYPDNYIITLTHENGCRGVFVVDVVSREAVRKLEVIGEDIYIEWQGRPDTLKTKNLATKELEIIQLYDKIDKAEGYNSTIIENQYLDEIHLFIMEIEGKDKSKYTFIEDKYTLDIIDKIEGIKK